MKWKKSKHSFGILFFLVVATSLFWNCNPEEDSFIPPDPKAAVETVSLAALPPSLTQSVQSIQTTAVSDRNGADEWMIVDEDQILKMVDSLENTRYSVRFSLPEQPEHVLYNLVLGTNHEGQEIAPFVLKYSIENLDEVRKEGVLDMRKMKGRIAQYSLDGFVAYTRNYLNPSNRGVANPCHEYSDGGGGDSERGVFDQKDDGSNDQVTCHISVWSVEETGEVFAISWSCSDGTSGSQYFDRSVREDCQRDGGGWVPINQSSCTGGKIKDNNGNCACPEGMIEDSSGNCIIVSPCDQVFSMAFDDKIKGKATDLERELDKKYETGYKQNANGKFSDMPLGEDGATLNLIIDKNTLGYIHNHPDSLTFKYKSGRKYTDASVKMFSPTDVTAFLRIVKNANGGNVNPAKTYAGLVTSNGNYILKFAGNPSQLNGLPLDPNLPGVQILYNSYVGGSTDSNKHIGLLKFIKKALGINDARIYKYTPDEFEVEGFRLSKDDLPISDDC